MRRRQFFRALLGLAALPLAAVVVSPRRPGSWFFDKAKRDGYPLDLPSSETLQNMAEQMYTAGQEAADPSLLAGDFYAGDWIDKLDEAVIP